MSELMVTAVFLAIMCMLLIYRVAKGPHVVDRIVASDTIDVITTVILVLFGVFAERSIYLDIALVVALLGFISTVIISRYLEGR